MPRRHFIPDLDLGGLVHRRFAIVGVMKIQRDALLPLRSLEGDAVGIHSVHLALIFGMQSSDHWAEVLVKCPTVRVTWNKGLHQRRLPVLQGQRLVVEACAVEQPRSLHRVLHWNQVDVGVQRGCHVGQFVVGFIRVDLLDLPGFDSVSSGCGRHDQ